MDPKENAVTVRGNQRLAQQEKEKAKAVPGGGSSSSRVGPRSSSTRPSSGAGAGSGAGTDTTSRTRKIGEKKLSLHEQMLLSATGPPPPPEVTTSTSAAVPLEIGVGAKKNVDLTNIVRRRPEERSQPEERAVTRVLDESASSGDFSAIIQELD